MRPDPRYRCNCHDRWNQNCPVNWLLRHPMFLGEHNWPIATTGESVERIRWHFSHVHSAGLKTVEFDLDAGPPSSDR